MLQLLQVTLILPLLFLKVIGENEATRLLRKVRKLSGKHFGDSFEYVKYSDMIKRTNNEQLFFTVEMIGLALKMRRKISFYYRRNGVLRENATTVSPFHIFFSFPSFLRGGRAHLPFVFRGLLQA